MRAFLPRLRPGFFHSLIDGSVNMNLVTVIPLSSFQHGAHSFEEGIPKPNIPEHVAAELERHGLVRVRQTEVLRNQMEVPPLGKSPAVGEAVPSQSSPAAPVSQSATPPISVSGPKKPRRYGR